MQKALELGQTAIASTEHGRPRGWVAKKIYCDKIGIKFIHGVEIYLTESLEEKVRDNYHTILLAKNETGVQELNRLVSLSCKADHFYFTNRLTFDEFLNISDNIITTSACLASPLNKLPDSHPRYLELARKYTFLEIQPHDHPEQVEFNKRLLKLSQSLGIPLIAGTDAHSVSSYAAECRKILLSAKNKNYGDEDAFDLTYKSYDELIAAFKKQGALDEQVYLEAIENTNKMNDAIAEFKLDTSTKYPILYGSREEDSRVFAETVERMFEEKVRNGVIFPEQVDSFRLAIDEEMRVFKKLNMEGFMLSMSELLRWCKSQGMAIGTARGSVGGSRIAYVTDIIDLNPETWHTVFSRFCNEDREEIGDIDIDCIDTDRPKIFNYITQRFGEDKTARVAAYGTIKSKGVVDEIGRHLSRQWIEKNGEINKDENPYSYANLDRIKAEFDCNEEATRKKYPEIFYYYDGLFDVRVSQSVHPAGMVISPVSLVDYYGVFDKDEDRCLMIDMTEAHDVGAAKYDFLVLKTVQVIKTTCDYLGRNYPLTHEIDWNDKAVWDDMIKSPGAIFQFEGEYAFTSLKKFKPRSIFDMSLVTAAIRPSGASYRDALMNKELNHNPSELIDKLLENNLGYLIYQEDVIAFLQQVCGLTGSEADNVRRAIGRKDKDRLDKAMPQILEGYCQKSDKPREEAETEALIFLKIIEDASSYMFGYNHSIAYCLLGYLCAYYRYYHPGEFITAFLNNAANNDDIKSGTNLIREYGYELSPPRFGYSTSGYTFNNNDKVIAKGLSSVKYISENVADELFQISQERDYNSFIDVLQAIDEHKAADVRQIDVLIKIDYFAQFGNQRTLLRICDMYEKFKRGAIKKMKKEPIAGTVMEHIVQKYATGTNKDGKEAASWTFFDVHGAMAECEQVVREAELSDLPDIIKIKNFSDIMGYVGYVSGKEEDRPKLYVKEVYPLKRKKDGAQFGYSVITQSIGSGRESRFTVYNRVFNKDPIKKDDLIICKGFTREGQYFTLTSYVHIYE